MRTFSAIDLSDSALRALAEQAGALLLAAGRRVATAESCTGGWVAKCLTDIPGSSRWFERGYVTYSDLAKQQSIGVAPGVIQTFGAVSRPTVEQMAAGALHASGADIAVAIEQRYSGDREAIRRASVATALRLVIGAADPGRAALGRS